MTSSELRKQITRKKKKEELKNKLNQTIQEEEENDTELKS